MKKSCLLWIIPLLAIAGCGQQKENNRQTVPISEAEEVEEVEEVEWETGVMEETIVIPGLSKSYSYLFLTDAHIVVIDEGDNRQVKEYARQRSEEFTFQNSNTSKEQFSNWMKYVSKQQLDGLLLGGDIIDTPSGGNLQFLKAELKEINIPYLYNLGNHDWTFPWDYMTEQGKNTYLPLLSEFLGDTPAIQTIETEEFVIVAVDNSSNQINPDALEEYRAILTKGKPVILMLHVPLLTQSALGRAKEIWPSGVILGGGNYGGIYPDETSAEFIDLTTNEASPVIAVLAGHVHFYDKDMINDRIVQIVGGAAYEGNGVLLRLARE